MSATSEVSSPPAFGRPTLDETLAVAATRGAVPDPVCFFLEMAYLLLKRAFDTG